MCYDCGFFNGQMENINGEYKWRTERRMNMKEETKANYYALMISILTGETANKALKDMGFAVREEDSDE